MRKDVKLGFSAGGVVLAIVIAVVLFTHHKPKDKAVGFDPGKASAPAPAEPNSIDIPAAPTEPVHTGDSALAANGRQNNEADRGSGDASDPSASGTGDRWDTLFASSSEDPLKPQVRSDARVAAPVAHDPVSSPGVANTTIDAGPSDLTTPRVSDPAPTTRPSGAGARSHTVQQGETFSSISKVFYGDARYFKAIEAANPKINPNKLHAGLVIQLPSPTDVKQGHKTVKPQGTAAAESHDPNFYTVKSGDTLYRICRQLYGNGAKETDLYTLNKEKIGPDHQKLKIGTVLKLPSPATVASR